jgi:hypothetical protein
MTEACLRVYYPAVVVACVLWSCDLRERVQKATMRVRFATGLHRRFNGR